MTGLLNPDSPPTSTKVPAFDGGSNEIRAAAAYTLGAELIDSSIEQAGKHTPEWPAKVKATIVGSGLGGTPKMSLTGFRKVGRPDDEKFPSHESRHANCQSNHRHPNNHRIRYLFHFTFSREYHRYHRNDHICPIGI